MRQIRIIAALAALGLVTSATAAQAQITTNTTESYAFSGWVPCADNGAGELVTGTIDAHVLATSTVNDTVDAWQFMFAPRGTLVGRKTGESYQLTGVQRGTYVDGEQGDRSVLTYVNRYQLIGAGSAGNLVVRETAHVTRNGDDVVVQFDDYGIECQ